MNTADFDYELPPERIAQQPAEPRDAARLLVFDRAQNRTTHAHVRDLPSFVAPGTLVVFNDTRVRAARLFGKRPTGGHVELLLTERVGESPATFRAIGRARRGFRLGEILRLAPDVTATVVDRGGAEFVVRIDAPGDVEARIDEIGVMPLPPYIRRDADDNPDNAHDRERYQTVYARRIGAAAAPTAGLHFTPELIDALRDKGAQIGYLTLHVGLGTFLPVRTETIDEHRIHEEAFCISEELAALVAAARRERRPVLAVGTTVCRALEAAWDGETLAVGDARTSIFLKPGSEFRVVDKLMTNFHLPRSTLLMLVAAFMGREAVLSLYDEAIREGYRFYSYGDAMLIS
ncbi:tRNA preQ1(34) S-adenosylmethionine ribosyltransferase-isomerase QueA [bacterium]|nr:tRNA preQ1(34) S-adenosylmethionine ribosyltransferase-isomerase QueA [bacterium]